MRISKQDKTIVQLPMVGWYDPGQLRRSALQVAISTVLGRHADKRFLQALADTGDLRKKLFYEVVAPDGDPFWFDYASDVGDGFDPTFTVAHYLTRPKLSLNIKNGDKKNAQITERGSVLVLGGDEVYPVASLSEYKTRLTDPYNAAFPEPSDSEKKRLDVEPPSVFAIPGNHDWYDSLVAFSEIFCSQRWFAGWKTKQNRSYFAVKLPKGWWLFGTDMQLGSSLDKAQIDYFGRVMKHVGKDDRIILCNAEPHWITAKMYEDDPAFNNRNMGYFEGGVLRGQVAIYIAGDRHYYRRHEMIKKGKNLIDPESQSKVQKIVAGGGGAFLHPTHNEYVDEIGKRDIYALRKSYPDEATSKRLTSAVLLFPFWNWKFFFLPGALYLFTAQAFYATLGPFVWPGVLESLSDVFMTLIVQPAALFWVAIVVLGFLLFTDTHSKTYRLIAGPIHAFSHLTAVFVTGWITSLVVLNGLKMSPTSFGTVLMAGAVMFTLGGIVGSFLMGSYLFVSLNFFGRHHNETFSAIKIAGYKNFLRLKITSDGTLTIFPVGIEEAVNNWTENMVGSNVMLSPASEIEIQKPVLIEEPIVFKKPFDPAIPEIGQSDDISVPFTSFIEEHELS